MDSFEVIKADNGGYVLYHDGKTAAFCDAVSLIKFMNEQLETGLLILDSDDFTPPPFIPGHGPCLNTPERIEDHVAFTSGTR